MTSRTSAIAKMSKPVINPPRPAWLPARYRLVCKAAAPVQPAVLGLVIGKGTVCRPPDGGGGNAWTTVADVTLVNQALVGAGLWLDPPLQLAQDQLADHVHAGLRVVQAGDCGKLLATAVLENFGVFLRDLLQRLQAI